MRKILHQLHLWLSIPVGLIISIICFSGAVLVFEKEITEYFNKKDYYVESSQEVALPISKIIRNISTELPDSVSVTGITISKDPNRAYQLSLSKPRRASVYVNQYTGEIVSHYKRSEFFLFFFRLHRWLLDSAKQDGSISWGKMIVGVSTIIFVFILLTGLLIWIPRNKHAIKNRLSINFNKGWRRFFYDLHVAGGFYTLIILLTLSLTGLTWSFQWYREGFYKVFGVEMQQPPMPGNNHNNTKNSVTADNTTKTKNKNQDSSNENNKSERKNDAVKKEGDVQNKNENLNTGDNEGRRKNNEEKGRNGLNTRQWQNVYITLKTDNPNFTTITINNGSANVAFNNLGNQRASDKYDFDQGTGKITEFSPYKSQPNSAKIRGWIYSVHVGSWGGYLTKILTMIAALIGATLPITGYYFWIKKEINKRKRKRRSSTL